MDEELAREIAQLLLKHEPEKKVGGSKERQRWLHWVMQMHMIMLENDMSEVFRDALFEG